MQALLYPDHNKSITTVTYLSKLKQLLKQAKVVLIYRTDNKTDPNNYRPISPLSNFNRILEKTIYK